MLSAGRDWVVSLKAQREFFNGLSSPVKRMHVFPAAYHAIFHEKERAQVVDRAREFILERFAAPPAAPSLLEADKYGHTWEEYERLKLRGGPQFALVRAGMKTGGRLSKGIDLGWRSGFDSGLTLDYVYENKPRGATALGRLIDHGYLNSIGWRGIRQRKKNLEKLLRDVIEETHAAGQAVRIVDIAAGGGRYLLETMRALPEIPMTALLRDYKQENVDAATRLARDFDLTNVTVSPGNAFDRASLASIEPRPTIGIVSGLFELFPSNADVLTSLRGLADAIEPGGHLIYTNQPWHPQVEFIARVLRNREGEPWIMRRRTTAEMDELVRTAGFEKMEMEVDEWGIFTVSVARRGGSSAPPLDDKNGRLRSRHSEVSIERRSARSTFKALRRVRWTLGALPRRLRLVQLVHVAAERRRHALLRMGAAHPVRSAHDRPLHVDRSVFRRRAFPLPQRPRTGYILQANCRRHSRRRRLLSFIPAPLRLRTPARRRLARRPVRLVSRDGSTLQSAAFAPHHAFAPSSRSFMRATRAACCATRPTSGSS